MDTTTLHLPHDVHAPRAPWKTYRKKPCGLWHFSDVTGREHGPYLRRGIARRRARELRPQPAQAGKPMLQANTPAGCLVTVDTRHASYVFRASAKWTVGGKIEARASCTSGALHAAIRCAAKMFGLTSPSITQLEAVIALQEVSSYSLHRPGFRQWVAVLAKEEGAAS